MTLTLSAEAAEDWPAKRVATSGYYHDSFHTIMTCWSLRDVIDANELIDAYEDAKAEAAEKSRGG